MSGPYLYAGPLQGLLGVIGANSRLFFILLCLIRTMQVLVSASEIRFLAENAGSMRDIHLVAFCKLLGLPHIPLDRYIWDLARFTSLMTRKRNFCRNFEDFEPMQPIQNFFDQHCGPLMDQQGRRGLI